MKGRGGQVDYIETLHRHYRRGEYMQCRRICEALLGLESASVEEHATAALMGAETAYQLDDIHAAIALSRRALDLAERLGDADRCGRAYFRLCGALIAAGENQSAVETALAFVDGMAGRWPHLDGELGAKALSNLAMAYRNLRRYPEALRSYWQSLVRFQRSNHVEGEINCRIQTAWLLTLLGDLDGADEQLRLSATLLSPNVSVTLSVHQLTTEALLRMHQGQFAEALELAGEVLAPGRRQVPEASRAVALFVTGVVSTRVGQFPTARAVLGLAQDAAIKSGIASVMNLVQDLFQEIRNREHSH